MKKKFLVTFTTLFSCLSLVTTSAANFYDIDDVPWSGAKQYINSVADKGLMVGDEDLKGHKVFRSRDKVTYCETVQLAYSLLTKTGKASSSDSTTTKWKVVMEGYNIPSWAHTAVAYALENGVISITDASKFMSSTGASNNATREGVAVIFGKALSKLYTVNQSASLTFKDSSSIAPTSVPYVDLLKRLNILAGDDENNFNPKNYINRAEMAVIVSQSYDTLASNSSTVDPGTNTTPDTSNGIEIMGSITDITSYGATSMITVMTTNGSMGFVCDSNTYIVNNSGSKISLGSLKVGDSVKVNYIGTKVNKITLSGTGSGTSTDTNTSSTSKSGTLNGLTTSRITVKNSSGDSSSYNLNNTSSIVVKIDGVTKSFTTLKNFYEAGVDYEVTLKLDSNSRVTNIDAKTKGSTSKLVGVVTSLSSSSITIKDSDGTRHSYTLAKESDLSIKVDGTNRSLQKFRDLYNEEGTIDVVLKLNSSDKVTNIIASTEADSSLRGTITSLSTRSITIKASDGTKSTYNLLDDRDMTIKINGSTKNLDKLKDAYSDKKTVKVTLSLNSYDEVVRIVATTTSSDDELEGRLIDITSSKIVIKNSDKDEFTYYFPKDEDDVTIKIDGTTRSISKLKSAFNDNNRVDVTVELDDDDEEYISYIRATTSSKSNDDEDSDEGRISNIRSGHVEIYSDDHSEYRTYDFLDDKSDMTIKLDGSSASIDDIILAFNKYNKVTAKLELDSHDRVTEIRATTSGSSSSGNDVSTHDGEIYSISSSKIRLDSSSGKSYSLASNVDVEVENGNWESEINTVNKLVRAIDDDRMTIEVTITVKDSEVTRITGRVTEVECQYAKTINLSDKKISIETPGGNSYTYTYKSNSSVTIDYYGSDDMDEFKDDYDDDDELVLTLNSSGYITKIKG